MSAEVHTAARDATIKRALRTARQHLGLEVASIAEFCDGVCVVRYVDAAADAQLVEVGATDALDDTCCARVASGQLPGFLRDAGAHPVAGALAVTRQLPIGTHLSVPVHFSDGRLYGTVCCFSRTVQPTVNEGHLDALAMLTSLVAEHLEAADRRERREGVVHDRIEGLLERPDALGLVLQPVFDLRTGDPSSAEALTRFPSLGFPPDVVFAQAWDVGLGTELEVLAVERALHALDLLPPTLKLGVNVSPAVLVTTRFRDAVWHVPPGRLIVEVTEHDAVHDYAELSEAGQRLRRRGISLWIDDVGMGFAGLNHILETEPDGIKVDAALVADVHVNPAKRAMIGALASFGEATGIDVIAEGIECAEELDVVRELGVPLGQGYHLGRPAPPAALGLTHGTAASAARDRGMRI